MLSVIVFLFLFKRYAPYTLVDDSNAPFAVLVSICAFMFFKNLKIRQSKFINTVGGGYVRRFTHTCQQQYHASMALERLM